MERNFPVPAIAPSLLASDFGRLAEEVARIEEAGADLIHFDVMDGHFVPNLTFGPGICEAVRRVTDLYIDVHLMLDNPQVFFKPFAEAGADNITFHAEVTDTAAELTGQIHDLGLDAGITVNPDVSVELLRPVVDDVEMVLIMSVFAGFGGQKFIPSSIERVRTVRPWLRDGQRLEIDGGITPETAVEAARAGADVLVAGTSVFRAPDAREAIAALRAAAVRV
ncbi:MAG: ribulose-phosphate 3-epimerase [Planctomycetes bacterium]|nr:ribulose-phosphate 3-epimerase [Planctomycetota bacterium]